MIVLLGGSGYIGQAFQRQLKAAGQPFANLSRKDADYTRLETLIAELKKRKPEFLINAAGYTGKPNVDACEIHKTECLDGNSVLPGTVAMACSELKIPWGHVSSGCVYNGRRADGKGFTESDPPNFSFRQNYCSFYSGTKALGEEILRDFPELYGWRGRIPFSSLDSERNYLSKLMRYQRLLDAENSLSQLDEFVGAALESWTKRIPYGIYNMTNPGSVTTREVVDLIKKSGVSKKEFSFFKDENEFLNLAVKTPRSNCILDTTKLQKAGIQMDEVHVAIEKALKNWQQSR